MNERSPMTGYARRAVACVCTIVASLTVPAAKASAQSGGYTVEDFVGAYVGPNAQGFFGPLATVLTSSLNTGFTGPAPKSRGFSIRLGLLAPTTRIGTSQQTFAATTGEGFRPSTTVQAPTILGPADPVIVKGEGGTGYVFPGGLALTQLAVPLPQLTIGALGSEAKVRWAGLPLGDEFGDLELLGLGLRHSISPYLPPLPVNLAIGGMYNSLKIGDNFDVTALLVDVSASRRVGWFDVYGGLGWQDSSMEIAYDSDSAESGRVQIDLDGAKGVRGTAGIGLLLPLVALTADINFGSQTILGVGLSFGLR